MLVLVNTGLVQAMKREIATLYPRVKSSVLTEALARGLGFETQAVMLSRIPEPTNMCGHSLFSGAGMPCALDDAAFLRYLDRAGVRGCTARPDPVYAGLWPTNAAERPMLQAVLRVDMAMSAIAESQGEALLCRLASSAAMNQHLVDTLPQNPLFCFEEPIGSSVGIRLDGYVVGGMHEPYGWTRTHNSRPSCGVFDGELAQGYVERQLETLCHLAAMVPPLTDEHAPSGFDYLWFGMAPVRLHWADGMHGTTLLLFPMPEGGYHSAHRFDIQWSSLYLDTRTAEHTSYDLSDADQQRLAGLVEGRGVGGAQERFMALDNLITSCAVPHKLDSTGRNVFREAQRFRDVISENHRDAPASYKP